MKKKNCGYFKEVSASELMRGDMFVLLQRANRIYEVVQIDNTGVTGHCGSRNRSTIKISHAERVKLMYQQLTFF